MRKTLGHFLIALIWTMLCLGRAAAAIQPTLEWRYETRGKIYASPILTDLDGDGRTEILVCASRDKRLLCLDGAGGLLWDYQLEGRVSDGIQATASAVDYDGDGKKEVFFVDTNGVAGCLDYQGRLLWRTFTGDNIDYSGPVVADINNDGRIEVVFGSDSGTVYCLDDCGMELWHYQGEGQIRSIPALAYHAPSRTMRIYVTFGKGVAACLNSEGKIVWSKNDPGPRGERRSGPALGDLNGDGRLDVVSATEDFNVIASDAETGAEQWRWKSGSKAESTGSFALADFEGKGRQDVVCGDFSGHVYRLRDGQALWTADVGGGVVQGPSIADADGDGELDILLCSRSNRLVVLSAAGQEKWFYPSLAGSLTTPAVGDVDNDGRTEVVFSSKDRYVYCVTVGGTYRVDRMPWPMLSHDAQLSGNTAGPFTTVIAAPTAPPAQAELQIDHFGPLAMGANAITFTFSNAASRPRHLEAVAELMRPGMGTVTKTVTERIEAFESKTARMEAPALFEGRYLLSIRLVDVGTGKTLATLEDTYDLRPFDAERKKFKTLYKTGARLTRVISAAPARQRAETALQEARKAVQEALPSTLTAQAPLKERGALTDGVHAALDRLQRVVARLRAASVTPGAASDFAVVPETPLKKVFKDEPFLDSSALPRPCSVSLAGNELEGIQLVVVPLWKDLAHLRVTGTDLVQKGGTGRIPAADLVIYRIGYVQIGPSEYNYYVEKQGEWPDITFPNAPIDMPAAQDAQPYLVTVKTQEMTPPGDYEGLIRVQADGCAPVELPLSVHVWDFRISKETHLKTSFWLNEGQIQSFYKYPNRTPIEVRKRFYQYQLEHRAGALKTFPLGGGDQMEDFEFLMANGQNCFFVDIPYGDPAERAVFAQQLKATQELLKERHWDDKALFYSLDEIAVMQRHVIPKMVETNAWIKTVLPEWPRLETSAPEQALFGAVDVWCPTIDHFDPGVLNDCKARGDRNWFYTVWGRPGIMVEFPATDARLMFWECWKYGAEGFLYWGTTHWSLNMTTDRRWPEIPWIPWNEQPGHNGCGYLIYPGPGGTPIGSLRFELIRDGIEDYEYFYLLRNLVEKAGAALPSDLKARAEAELSVAPEVLTDNAHFTDDPDAILTARARIAELIEQLRRRTQK